MGMACQLGLIFIGLSQAVILMSPYYHMAHLQQRRETMHKGPARVMLQLQFDFFRIDYLNPSGFFVGI